LITEQASVTPITNSAKMTGSGAVNNYVWSHAVLIEKPPTAGTPNLAGFSNQPMIC
jgi:hypothetical protein